VDDPTTRTRETYDRIGARFLENARDRSAFGPWFDRLAAGLPAGATVLDLGSGPGMDSAELRRRGLRAIGLDFSIGMLRAGAAEFPGPRIQGDARRLPVAGGSLAAVWANASLLHFTPHDFHVALTNIARVLKLGGLLYISVKQGVGDEWESSRYGAPRFFQYWTEPELDRVLVHVGFAIVCSQVHEAPRNRWLVRLAVREGQALTDR
jgi:SAM-dependent methyltransferase